MEVKRRGRPPGQPNPNAGRPAGQPNPNAGRRPGSRNAYHTNLNRLLDICVGFSDPHTLHCDVYGLGKCSACGAVWWEAHMVTVRGVEPEHILARVDVDAHPEHHRKGCVMA